jgi:molybdopterin converting factor subunit 1
MRVRVLFFGILKDLTGRSEDQIQLDDAAQLRTVFDYYADRFPKLRAMASSIVMARNHEFSPLTTLIDDGDEVAFLPPVSGGSDTDKEILDEAGHYFALTRQPIVTKTITDRLRRPSDGAVIAFEGVVRDNTKGRATKFLDYECYEAMALKMMAQIGLEIAATHAIGHIAIVHRLGRMEIGESSVVVVVSAPHRKPAFAAALEGIDRLKKIVPIWKKEHFVDGEVWVEGEWDETLPLANRS